MKKGEKNSGGVLLSHSVTRAVPSALEGLTSVFGMETGVSPPPSPPKNKKNDNLTFAVEILKKIMVKPHDPLVPVSSIHYWTYTSGLSTL
jgi:hypothetical protein